MNRFVLYSAFCATYLTNAILSPQELSYYQNVLPKDDIYVTQNGSNVNVMIPITRLYQQQTTYMAEQSARITEVLEELIGRSSGRVYLEGILSAETEGLDFATSALYAQVSHLSEFLLGSLSGISYSPVTVDHYVRNDNYGIWEIFPDDVTFVNLGLVVDK